MNECRIHTFPGPHVALQWEAPDPIPSETELAGVALTAVDALREVVQPLTTDLGLACCDPETRWPQGLGKPAHPYWQLRTAGVEEMLSLSPMYEGANVSESPQLDRQSIQRWIEDALCQSCDEAGAMPAWADLWILATCARLPEHDGAPTLNVHAETGPIEVPVRVEGSACWACGPVFGARTEPPIDIAFHSEGGVISLKIHVHWSLWTEAGTPGRRALDKALDQVRLQGWEEISNDLPSTSS